MPGIVPICADARTRDARLGWQAGRASHLQIRRHKQQGPGGPSGLRLAHTADLQEREAPRPPPDPEALAPGAPGACRRAVEDRKYISRYTNTVGTFVD